MVSVIVGGRARVQLSVPREHLHLHRHLSQDLYNRKVVQAPSQNYAWVHVNSVEVP